MKRIDFLYFDAGGGHRSAALALQAVIQEQQRPWDIQLVNLQEVLDSLDIFRKYTGVRLEDVYNHMLKRGYTLGSRQLLRAMHGIIRVYHRAQVKLLTKFWTERDADLVVSLIPNFNRAIFQGLRAADRARNRPPTPMVTILTDLADFPPHFWIERQDQYFVCGTAKAEEDARSVGHPEDRVFRTSGMIVRPHFYVPVERSRAEERARLGLDPELPTGLVLFGGQGSNQMVSIAKAVGKSGLKLQLILICGRNHSLRDRLKALKLEFPMYVEGFTTDIPYFMHLSDFFIGKPGPGSISEAIHMNLPVIVERNAWTLPQERYNAEWVEENQVGVVLPSFRRIADGLKTLLEERNFARFKANAAAIKNRAVFEIPEILEGLLRKAPRNQILPGPATRPPGTRSN
ncbi:MAG: galactosyldiacylglycerol synthase [Acidobacteriota bacterium]|nr:galactosyldiacylglycerol synthase [Acidobacteriota bacterium]